MTRDTGETLRGDPPPYRSDAGTAWIDPAAAAAYRLRPSYPPETFRLLLALIEERDLPVLDMGCGTGFLARNLAPFVVQVDAVDLSPAMIQEGKHLPGGDHPHLNWIVGRAEDAPLQPPYALAVAGDSFHWMDWSAVLPRLAGALSSHGVFALLTVDGTIVPEDEDLEAAKLDLIERYSTYWHPNVEFLDALRRSGLFWEEGQTETAPVPLVQTVDEYVESFHARASLAHGRLAPADAAAFDAALRALLMERVGETVRQDVRARLAWGKPLPS